MLNNFSIQKLNKKKTIFKLFSIPSFAQKVDYDFSLNYIPKYFQKSSKESKLKNKAERVQKYLSFKKVTNPLLDAIPNGENDKNYRCVVNYIKGSDWLKKAQRKFHKCIIKLLGDIPYLHSTVKSHSYATNGRKHALCNYNMLVIDLKEFFNQIDINKVQTSLANFLDIDNDVSSFYSKMVTSPDYKANGLILGQGLPSSPILAYLANKSLFDYLYKICLSLNIVFTVYVDDVCFSSEKEFDQKFINRIIGLFKGNGLLLNRNKIKLYKSNSIKRITGVYIKNGNPKIAFKKHEETFVLYKRIVELIQSGIKDISEYFEIYNLFVKFSGNFNHLIQVEYGGETKNITNFTHRMYLKLYRNLLKYYKPGLKKLDKFCPYETDNIETDVLQTCLIFFKKYQKDQSILKSHFPLVNK